MPVVELSYSRLQKLIGKVSKKQISDSLPFLGLDIESEDKNRVRVGYSPNRPDYSTDIGIALGLQGLLGIKTGALKLKIKKSNEYTINVKSNVTKIRPYVTGFVAKNGKIDEEILEWVYNQMKNKVYADESHCFERLVMEKIKEERGPQKWNISGISGGIKNGWSSTKNIQIQ